jgi:signal transduction histidine kinase
MPERSLHHIAAASREGVAEIRGFMQSLDTSGMSWRILAAELKNQGAKMLDPYSIAFTIESSLDDVQEQPESVLWTNLFMIYREALTNVIKHSKAASVSVALGLTSTGLRLVVQDDGIGCTQDRRSGRGLTNMKKRADEVGGRLTVSAEPGTGVTLEVPLPLKFPAS